MLDCLRAAAEWVWANSLARAALGYGISLFAGAIVVQGSLIWMWEKIADRRIPRLKYHRRSVPRWFTGMVERFIFTSAVWAGAPDVLTGMLAWLALKLAANWQRRPDSDGPKMSRQRRRRMIRYGFAAMMAGAISMMFAGIGGYVAALEWPG